MTGQNLKLLREANNLTQEQMADYLGAKRSAYSNYESGDRTMPYDMMEKACSLLGCDIDLLFEEDKDVVNGMLACAFRVDGLSVEDMRQVANFKEIVMNYMKMTKKAMA